MRLAGRSGGCRVCRCVLCIALCLPYTDRHSYTFISHKCLNMPIPAAALSGVWVRGRSLAGTAGSNSAGGMDSAVVVCNSARVHEIFYGTWRCQGRDLKCGMFSISTGPVLLNTVS